MNEFLFPVLGAALIVLVALPLSGALSSAALWMLDQFGGRGLLRFSCARYLLLVLPSVLPIAWTMSAAVHQAETGRSVIACLLSHELEQLCVEPLLLVAVLLVVLSARAWPWVAEYRRASQAIGTRTSVAARRVDALIAEHETLRLLKDRFVVTDRSVGGSATVGLWAPVVALDACFVERCDDEALLGALAHELEHVRRRDPLRYFVLGLAMRLNPAGERLLRRAAAAWLFAREVQCDRSAVLAGAEPTGVARALVAASRPAHPALAHVRGGPLGKLKVRVELLLAYEENRPADDTRQGASALMLAALALAVALWLPHDGSTAPLDALHTAVERAAAAILN